MPNSLQRIDCSYNQIIELPDKMPDSLQTIDCSNNQITKFPDKMPDSLQIIDCSNNQIIKLPGKMPDSLQTIYCEYNKITELPLILRINKCQIRCDNTENKFYMAAINLLKRNITKNKYKKVFYQLIVCNKLFNMGFNDCSFIISQYL
jgi:Leucine-rich repeat (LRR) protein